MEKQARKTLKQGVQWLIGSGIIATIGLVGFFAYTRVASRSPHAVSARVTTVKLGKVADTINESGTVVLGNQQTLKAPFEAGVVERVDVRTDDPVVKGQVLVVLREPRRETALAQKQLEIQQKQLQLARSQEQVAEARDKLKVAQQQLQSATEGQVEIGKQSLQLKRDREKVNEAETKLASLNRELQELEQLLEKGFIAANEVQRKQDEILAARAQVRNAELTAEQTNLEIQRLQKQLQTTQTERSKTVLEARAAVKQAELEANTNLHQLANLQLDLRAEKEKLQQSNITATTAGKVIDIKVKPGDVVKLGDPLLTLGDPAREEVHLELNTLDAARVQPNFQVRASTIGPQSQEFPGRIVTLARLAVTSSETDLRGRQESQATVQAIARLDLPSRSLIPGSSVNVEIILAQREKVVVLETELIQREGKETFVWVLDRSDRALKQPVTLGLEGLTTVEIKSGLKPGDRVVISTPDLQLEPGRPVAPQAESKEP
jgi:HlyD family secretion protein